MTPLSRRAFLIFTGYAAAALGYLKVTAGRAAAAAQPARLQSACTPAPGFGLPMSVPFAVGEDCAPPPTPTPSLTPAPETATPTLTVTVTASPSASPSASPTQTVTAPAPTSTPRRLWLPWVKR